MSRERLALGLQRGLEAILTTHTRQGARHLFGGSFDRLEVLGSGASAVVFRASDRLLSREVAAAHVLPLTVRRTCTSASRQGPTSGAAAGTATQSG